MGLPVALDTKDSEPGPDSESSVKIKNSVQAQSLFKVMRSASPVKRGDSP